MVWDGRYHQYVRESTLLELRARLRDREAFKGGWVAVDSIYVVQFSLGWFDEKGLDVESGRDWYLERAEVRKGGYFWLRRGKECWGL